MEKSKVYFTNFRTQAFGDGLPTKLKKMIKKPVSVILIWMANLLRSRCILANLKYQLSSSELCKSSCRCGKKNSVENRF